MTAADSSISLQTDPSPSPVNAEQTPKTTKGFAHPLCRWPLVAAKVVGLLAFLYFFVCSLDLMSSAFRLLGGLSHRSTDSASLISLSLLFCPSSRQVDGSGVRRRFDSVQSDRRPDARPSLHRHRPVFLHVDVDRRRHGLLVQYITPSPSPPLPHL